MRPLSALKFTGNSVSIRNIGTSLAAGLTGSLQIPDPLGTVTPSQIVFNGTVINANAQTYNSTGTFNMNSGATTTISTNGQPIDFTNGEILLATNTNLTINTSNGAITTADIHAGTGSLRTLILNAGTAALQPGTIGLAGNGEFTSVSLTGTLTLPNNIAANSITFVPTGTMLIGGNLVTVGTTLTFPNAVQLTGSKTFATGGGGIVFSNTLDSDALLTPRTVILAAGAGDITFNNTVGGTNPLNVLTIASARNVTATAVGTSITAEAIIQAAGTGTTEFSRNVTTTTAAGFQFTGTNLQFDSTSVLTTTNSGPLTVANSGTFTFDGTAALSDRLNQTGSGGVQLSGSIAAGGDAIFAGSVALNGTPSIDTSSNNHSITFNNFVNGPGSLTLTAGTGNIFMNNLIGSTTALGAVTFVSANNITIQSLTASSITTTNFSGTMNYQSITTTGNLSFTGTNFIRNGTLSIGGSVTLTNSGFFRVLFSGTATVGTFYTQNGTGPIELSGTIQAGTNISFASPITLINTSGLTSTGNGTITLSNTVDGIQDLTLSVGSGIINLNNAVGSTNPLGALTISTAGTVNTLVATTIQASSITQSAGTGTSTFNGDLTTLGSSGISLTGTNFVRGANWTTTNGGPITVTIPVGGSFTSTAAGTITAAGGFSQLGSGSVSLSQEIDTSSTDILFSGPITLLGTTTLNTGGLAGNITLQNTVDGAFALNLTSGSGNIQAQGAIGSGTRLGSITLTSANNASFQSLTAASFTQNNGTGTTTFSGPTDLNTATGLVFHGSNFTINGSLNISTNGSATISNSGLLTVTGTCTISKDFIQNGTGSSLLSGSIAASTGQIAFSSPVAASGTAQLTTTAQPISFASTIDGPSVGSGSLILNSSATGDITVTGAIGSTHPVTSFTISNARNVTLSSISAGSITQSAGAGTTSILGNINTTNITGVGLIGTFFTINGSIITTNGGPVNINHSNLLTLISGSSTLISGPFAETGAGTVSMSGTLHTSSADITFHNPITLLAPTIINSDGSGDILLSSTVSGPTDLTLDSGTSDITALGAITVNNLTITATNNATFLALTTETITQLAGSGTTTFNGAVSTSLVGGINLTGTAFLFNAPITTTGSGPVSVNNSDLLTITAAGAMNLTGPFTQSGSGNVLLSGNISVDNDAISFNGQVTLGNTVSLNTATATGSITFSNILNGNQNLNLAAGAGSITMGQTVGGTTPLNIITVTSAANFTSQTINAASLNFSGISNLATFNGPISTTGGAGISLTGFSFLFNQNITTTNAGSLTITNTGPVTFSPTGTVSTDGAFSMNGTGLVNAGGSLTTNNQPATFSSAVLLDGNYSINTGVTGGNVTFSHDLDGAFNLSIAAGIGTASFQKAIGDGGALSNFTITAQNVNMTGIGTASSGVTGAVNVTATNVVQLDNVFYTAGSQSYTAGTAINFINAASTTLLTTTGGSVSFSGAPIVLATSNDLVITTNNGSLTYTSISGSTFENLTFNLGSGTAFLNPITANINNVTVNAGQIEIIGSINDVNTNFQALGSIFNSGTPVAINSQNTATFNALGGNVGTNASPILVNTSNQIFAGADGNPRSFAIFNGTSVDNTVHAIPSNPPCIIIFNGVVIKDCTIIPGTPPIIELRFPFAVPGVESSTFNLASDYFFFPYYFDDSYLYRDSPIYYRASGE